MRMPVFNSQSHWEKQQEAFPVLSCHLVAERHNYIHEMRAFGSGLYAGFTISYKDAERRRWQVLKVQTEQRGAGAAEGGGEAGVLQRNKGLKCRRAGKHGDVRVHRCACSCLHELPWARPPTPACGPGLQHDADAEAPCEETEGGVQPAEPGRTR